MTEIEKRITKILLHISHVQENTRVMGFALLDKGEVELAKSLIANGLVHDQTKLTGPDFDELFQKEDKNMLRLAIHRHNTTNKHHPEYWGGIDKMPDVYVAEMVCDWKARSSEMGLDFREWIEVEAPKKYGYAEPMATKIKYYASLITDAPFINLNK